jgi:hypothetical protein
VIPRQTGFHDQDFGAGSFDFIFNQPSHLGHGARAVLVVLEQAITLGRQANDIFVGHDFKPVVSLNDVPAIRKVHAASFVGF